MSHTLQSELERSLSPLRATLLAHPLYSHLQTEAAIHTFMASHVFAVWDFQSLLKALQRAVTCVEVPWLPSADPEARRLLNEIVLDEESDTTPDGGYLSHYELYVLGMERCGARPDAVQALLARLGAGQPWEVALDHPLPPGAARFVGTTLEIATRGQGHEIAAAFTYGREDVIPGMFRQVIAGLAQLSPQRWATFHDYLERHVHTDAERHYPMSRRLIARLCGEDPVRWSQAGAAAKRALQARLDLWDAIDAALPRP